MYILPLSSINPESRFPLFYDFVREYQLGVLYFSTIPFGSINPESRIFLQFRLGASTRSLVFLFPFLRFRLGVSTRSLVCFVHFLRFRSKASTRSLVFFLRFHSKNVTIFRIKVLEENSKKSEKNPKNRKRKIQKK